VGGPLALVRDGDPVRLDVPNRTLVRADAESTGLSFTRSTD
jgi:dihydroxyacid dehydratase/phosphogluconate dehydratase